MLEGNGPLLDGFTEEDEDEALAEVYYRVLDRYESRLSPRDSEATSATDFAEMVAEEAPVPGWQEAARLVVYYIATRDW